MRKLFFIPSLVSFFLPLVASAHEVYVLSAATAARDIAMKSPNPFEAYVGNEFQFYFWGFICAATVLTIFCASIYRAFERAVDPFVFRLKRFAHPMVRFTCGVCLIACAYYSGLFGPELPFLSIFGAASSAMQIVFFAAGSLILLGLYTRAVAALMLLIYVYTCTIDGSYMLTYANYFGEFALLMILGAGSWSVDEAFRLGNLPKSLRKFAHKLTPYAFPIMRILLGFGIVYASVYAKFIHSQLALDVVNNFGLLRYFHFDPLFVVLGALIIEFLAGFFLIIGFEIRWVGLFLLFWLTLSLLYFGESVWPHIVLFGLGLAVFFHGYDHLSIEGYFFKKHGREPVL